MEMLSRHRCLPAVENQANHNVSTWNESSEFRCDAKLTFYIDTISRKKNRCFTTIHNHFTTTPTSIIHSLSLNFSFSSYKTHIQFIITDHSILPFRQTQNKKKKIPFQINRFYKFFIGIITEFQHRILLRHVLIIWLAARLHQPISVLLVQIRQIIRKKHRCFVWLNY